MLIMRLGAKVPHFNLENKADFISLPLGTSFHKILVRQQKMNGFNCIFLGRSSKNICVPK